ncbi:MAG: GatB/YqeY domain-containing protein [Candidatus Kerfeldbacteria bacterium]|nr:GatB/YqeY domain-containing protein [Candidatus Kerfeldbacteria bacterium]
MELSDTIQQDLVQALKQRNPVALTALRSLKSALQRAQIEHKQALNEVQALAIVQKEIKQRQDSVASYQAAQRTDLVDKEQAELAILQRYQPAQLSPDQLQERLRTIVVTAPVKEFGPVMKLAMAQLQGLADGKVIQAGLKSLLAETQ